MAKLEAMAAAEIAKHPEKRDEILRRLRKVSEQYVANLAHAKRKNVFFGSLLFALAGLLIGWIGNANDVKIIFAFGCCAIISGVLTALFNIPIRR